MASRAEFQFYPVLPVDFAGAQHVLALVEPKRDVIGSSRHPTELARTIDRVPYESQIVRHRRRRHECAENDIGSMVEADQLRESVAEYVPVPVRVAECIVGVERHVIDAPYGRTSWNVALRSVGKD